MTEAKLLPEDYDAQTMQAEFEESYEMLCATNEPFHKKMKRVFALKGITADIFCELTNLHRNYYSKFMKEGYIPRMSTFISMCMGLNLDLPTTESLLSSLSLGFDRTCRLDCAYMFLLTHYQGLHIECCNMILNDLGIKDPKYLLGTYDLQERNKLKIENQKNEKK